MSLTIGNIRTYKGDAYTYKIDRSNKVLGNPFYMKDESQRDMVCEQYKKWIDNKILNVDTEVMLELYRIENLVKTYPEVVLLCWCSPKRCHGEIIKEIIDTNVIVYAMRLIAKAEGVIK